MLLQMHSVNIFSNLWRGHAILTCLILCNLLSLYSALYEDQVGKFDWRQQYIGNVINAHFEHNVGNHKIIVATEQNVLAALNLRTNQTVWRQVLETKSNGKIHTTIASGGDILSVNGDHPIVRSWDSNTGILNWETNLRTSLLPGGSQTMFYQFRLSESLIVLAECVDSKAVNFQHYNYLTGEKTNSKVVPAPWFNKNTKCQFVNEVLFVCNDDSSVIHSINLNQDSVFLPTTLSSLGLTENTITSYEILPINSNDNTLKRNLFALKSATKQVLLVENLNGVLKTINTFLNADLITTIKLNGDLVIVLLTDNNKGYTLKAFNTASNSYVEEISGSLFYPDHHGLPSKMFADISQRKDGSFVWRLLLTTSTHSVLYFNGGALQWNREESLASILSVEMVELPISESEAQMEEQFQNVNANIMILFLKRLTTQLVQLQNFLTRVLLNVRSDSGSHKTRTGLVESDKLIRDEFDIHKVIVIVTAPGKIFGMDSLTGKIIWQNLVTELQPFQRLNRPQLPLYVLRTTAHYSFSPQCAVVGSTEVGSVVYTFNPITGEPVGENKGINLFDFNIIQAVQLSFHDFEFLRGIIMLDSNYQIHVFPKSYSVEALQHKDSCYMFIADPYKGELKGFTLALSTSEKLFASEVWSLAFQTESQRITNVVMKRSDEHVHSQGRVMGDRSVLYKYLNPNLAVVTTESIPGPHQSALNVYLVDVVSGQVVFSASHKRAKGPMHVVHSENWIVYSYMSEKHRRVEVSVLELYEGKTQSNTTYFSSLSPPPSPMVERQAYIFYTQIDALSVTTTQKGITSKHLLFALPGGGILELPKAFLDPRRSLFPTAEHREEGIIPYNPELSIPTENIINYNQSLYRIENIYTTPTGLESTCLVLAYGLDLFYTRVTPSKTFDVLKEDFDHWIIVMALTGLLVASYVTKKFAAKKALKQAWK